MNPIPIPWIALATAVFVKQAIGAVWYSRAGFGRRASALMGVGEGATRARLPIVVPLDFFATGVLAFVLLHVVRDAGAYGALSGGAVGATAWLGFVAVSGLNLVLYARRPFALYAIDMGFWLVALAMMGAILGVSW